MADEGGYPDACELELRDEKLWEVVVLSMLDRSDEREGGAGGGGAARRGAYGGADEWASVLEDEPADRMMGEDGLEFGFDPDPMAF